MIHEPLFTSSFSVRLSETSLCARLLEKYMEQEEMSFHNAILKISKLNGIEPQYVEYDCEKTEVNLEEILNENDSD